MSDAPALRLYLWPHRTMYLGLSPDNELHRHHAAQICIALDKTLWVQGSGADIRSIGVVIPPDCLHRINAGTARILAIYLEPESEDYESLVRPLLTNNEADQFSALEISPAGLGMLRELYATGGDADSAWSTCTAALGMGSLVTRVPERDPRVEQIMNLIRCSPDTSHSIDQLAQSVQLSPSRLTHLFREYAGIPIRRYTVWSRIRLVVNLAVEGATLTDAAHAAGFSDAAHMSKAFRQMFGFPPSTLFAKHIPKDIHILE